MQRPAGSIQQSSTVSFRSAIYSGLMSRTAGHGTGPQTLQSCLERGSSACAGKSESSPAGPCV